MVVGGSDGRIDFCPFWCANARLLGDADGGNYGAYSCLSGCRTICCGDDGIVSIVALVGRWLLGLGLYLFGRNISHNGDDTVGATHYKVVPLHILYGAVYRPSGARCRVVVFNAESGGDVTLLPAATVGLW